MTLSPFLIYMTKVLGFDISSRRTGVAVVNNGRLLKSSCEVIEPKVKWQYGEKLSYFKIEMKRIIQKHKPDYVIIEDIFKGRNLATFKTLAMFRGVAVQTIFEEMGTDPASIMPTDARSTIGVATGKEEAFAAITEKFKLQDFNFEDHNDIVDAIGLASAMHTLVKKGIDVKSLRSSRRRKKRKPRRNKKGVSKTSTKASSRQKS